MASIISSERGLSALIGCNYACGVLAIAALVHCDHSDMPTQHRIHYQTSRYGTSEMAERLTKLSKDMSAWVGLKKAGEIIGKDVSSVSRNATRGRLSFRVREGQIYYYREELERLTDSKNRNTGPADGIKVDAGADALGGTSDCRISQKGQETIQSVRSRLKQAGDDAICTVEMSDSPVLKVYRVVDGEPIDPVIVSLG
jgi:hypothetical protein